MAKKTVFISYDYDYDYDRHLKNLLIAVGQER